MNQHQQEETHGSKPTFLEHKAQTEVCMTRLGGELRMWAKLCGLEVSEKDKDRPQGVFQPYLGPGAVVTALNT